MRWLVEVSSLGKTDLQKFCVEAESWQRALQAARAQRGEEGPMSGFSIELLEEGYRAVDPLARVRFVVKRAPDDMPVTAPLAKESKGGVAPSPPSTAAATSTTTATEAKAPAAETKAAPSPASSSPATSSTPPRPMGADKGTNGSKKGLTFDTDDAKDKASPTKSTAPAAASAAAPASKAGVASVAPASKAAVSTAPAAAAASAAPKPIGSALPGLPPLKVLSSREQNPTDASPLTYREYSFAVPAGTSEDVATAVLKGQLEIVDAHLTGAKMGKLVNLAVFDVEFTGKPPAPPLATLSWKDWKGDPVIGYPRRGAPQKQVKPPSSPPAGPASTAAPTSSQFPPPSSMPPSNVPRPGAQVAAAAPVASPAPAASVPPATAALAAPAAASPASVAPVAAPAPAAAVASAPSAAPVAAATAATVPQPAATAQSTAPAAQASSAAAQSPFPVSPSSIPPPNPFAATAPLIAQAALPQQPASVPPPASFPPPAIVSPSQPPPAAVGAGGIPVPVVAPVATFHPAPPGSIPPPAPAVGSVPPPANASVPPAPVVAPAPAPAIASVPPPAPAAASVPPTATTSEAPAPRRSSPDGMVRTPSGRFVRGRTTGDELITALFESMHDLHFLRDALDGGQFCLALATEVLPARAALIHFFDVEKREWIIACTRGKDTSRLLTLRTPESDELLRAAARKRRAVVTPDAAAAATAQRYQSLGGSRSMIIAPIMQAGRALGAIEILNPLDGMPFTEDEGNAMTYIAEQYAEYLGSRGIVLDKHRIQNAAAPR